MKKKHIYMSIGAGLAAAVGVILLIWLFSGDKIAPGKIAPEKAAACPDGAVVRAELTTVTEWYEAVGTVVSKNQAQIEPRVTGPVMAVRVQAGDVVKKGDLLVRIDDDRLDSRLSQARQQLQTAISRRGEAAQAVNSAQAAFARAESDYNRIKKFYKSGAATEQDMEESRARFLRAKAALERSSKALSGAKSGVKLAKEMVREAEIALGYTEIRAPADGRILKRFVDPGDMAAPGKPLLVLHAAGGLQLEANVREGLMNTVRPGDERNVRLSAAGRTVEAVIAEVVPAVDPRTRTFPVKADLPELWDARPGMYGKLLIPYMDISVILIPQNAVRRVGQLELVTVKTKDRCQRRYIKTGKLHGDRVEVLSGLSGNESLLIEESGNNGR
ncbi:MAG: efflux RND transporter periplasmic adaptor subunit [Desulfosalsimonas sp.]|uniref:efflux RND transporter periplasmic adaptor subunit n=1 Tax=Desulfosalsimonas sp. TaxID=3073848 RepID=UPI003970DE16